MSFLTTLFSSFPILSSSIHHITLSSSHFHSHLIPSHHTSYHHSLCLLSHRIHLFILTTFHVFFHHRICITLITSHIHLSFISHHPHSILLPFHHSRIFHFSIHPFHHGALCDFLKTHFHSFHLSFPPIHYSILLSILDQLHHLHHHTSLLFIPIRIYLLYPFIFIHSHPILPLNHFNLTHSYPFPFLFYPLHPIHIVWLLSINVSQLWDQHHVCSDSCYPIIICCVERNTLSQLDVIAIASDVWFESSSIEWWGNERMGTWGLEGIDVVEAKWLDSIGW